MNSYEVRRAPHLVGIELVRASELVAVLLLIHTVKEGISSLEAELLVPHVVVGVSH